MKCYAVPGLGATGEIFQRLAAVRGVDLIPVTWASASPEEPIEKYVRRLLAQIDTTTPYAILGLSFGSVVAFELAKLCKPAPTFLIILSGIVSPNEMPLKWRLLTATGFHKLLPVIMTKFLPFEKKLLSYAFSTRDLEAIGLLHRMAREVGPQFISWAVNAMMMWCPDKPLVGTLIRIHGNEDRLLPLKSSKCDLVLSGGHLIVWSRGQDIAEFLESRLTS